MLQLVRTRRARQDLIDVWLSIAEDDPDAADRALDRIDAVCQLLAEYPAMGPSRDDIRPGLRYFAISPHLILYRTTATDLQIVRVIDGRRNLFRIF